MTMLCAAIKCSVYFAPRRYWQKYCSIQCKRREASRKHYRLNRGECIQANLRSHHKHRDSRLIKQRERYMANRDAERLRGRIYATQNRDKARERGRKYNPKRYAQKRGAGVITLTPEQWERIKCEHKHKCAYCRKRPKVLTQDHVIPLSKGGTHTANNVVPACRHCNSVKGNRDVAYFKAVLL